MADYEAGSSLHAALDIVVQFVFPSVDLGGTDVDTWLKLALLAFHGVDDDEGLRVFGETYRHQSLVKGQRFVF
jgi:hypothetical protein